MKKNNVIRKNFIFIVLIYCSVFLSAQQQIYELDLQKSIDIALEKSYTIKTLKADLKVAEYNLQSANRSFRTHLDLVLTVPNYAESLRKWEDSTGISYYPIKQMNYSGYVNLWQPLPTDGKISLTSGLDNTDDFMEDKKSFAFSNRIEFEQPIEALYSYNRIRSEFKRAKLNYELSNKQLKRTELDLIYYVSNSFYELVSAKERKNISYQSLLRQDEVYKIAQKKYESGLIREVEALQMEVDLAGARNEYDQADINHMSVSNDFKQLLGISLYDSIIINSDLSYDLILIDLQKAIDLGIKNRLEIREKEIQIELNEISLKEFRSRGLIRGKINAYYDFTGVDDKELPITFSNAFDNSWQDLRRRPNNRGIGLTLSVPIWDWGENRSLVNAQKARIERAMYSLDDTKVDIEKEIINTVNRLNSALRRLQLLEKSVQVAEKSFAISSTRFVNGDIDSESLALERERLNNAYVSRLNAFISYKLLLADLTRQTFFDFLKNKSLVEPVE
ncbi:MAG: TolC family protein [Bacteroidales bacterium]